MEMYFDHPQFYPLSSFGKSGHYYYFFKNGKQVFQVAAESEMEAKALCPTPYDCIEIDL